MKKGRKDVSTRMAKLKRKLGVSGYALSVMMSVSYSSVRRWSNGECKPLRAHRECRITPLEKLATEVAKLSRRSRLQLMKKMGYAR